MLEDSVERQKRRMCSSETRSFENRYSRGIALFLQNFPSERFDEQFNLLINHAVEPFDLCLAVRFGSTEYVKALVQKGCDLSTVPPVEEFNLLECVDDYGDALFFYDTLLSISLHNDDLGVLEFLMNQSTVMSKN